MAIWENKNGGTDWIYIVLCLCVFGCCLIPKFTNESNEEGNSSMSEYWYESSNGYSWINGTLSQKNALCVALAESSKNDCSSNYFADFFDNFYGSEATNKTLINEAAIMAEEGSKALPVKLRNY